MPKLFFHFLMLEGLHLGLLLILHLHAGRTSHPGIQLSDLKQISDNVLCKLLIACNVDMDFDASLIQFTMLLLQVLLSPAADLCSGVCVRSLSSREDMVYLNLREWHVGLEVQFHTGLWMQ